LDNVRKAPNLNTMNNGSNMHVRKNTRKFSDILFVICCTERRPRMRAGGLVLCLNCCYV